MLIPLLLLAPHLETPKVVHRDPEPYVAIKTTETMTTIGKVFPRLMPKLLQWARGNQIKQDGPPFIRFVRVDMEKSLDIEIGFPIKHPAKSDKLVTAGVLPGGDYVSLTHFGPYSGLVAPNADLQAWAQKKGLRFNMKDTKRGREFASRLEFYKTDPDHEPNPQKWETEILYMIKK